MRSIRNIIFFLSSLFFMHYSHAQFNAGNLKDFNLQMNVALLNYQVKAEYAPGAKHLLSFGVGYGSMVRSRLLPYSSVGKDKSTHSIESFDIFPEYYYYSFTATFNYRYYPLKPKEIQVDKLNQGFYFFAKLRFIGPERKLSYHDPIDHKVALYMIKPGLGFGINVKFNKEGTAGLDIHQGIGFVVNPYFNYAEVWPVMKTSIYYMLFSK